MFTQIPKVGRYANIKRAKMQGSYIKWVNIKYHLFAFMKNNLFADNYFMEKNSLTDNNWFS